MRGVPVLLLISLVDPKAYAADQEAGPLPQVSLMRPGTKARRGYIWGPNAAPVQALAAPERRTIYMNRHGGHYVGGADDNPATNTSYVVSYYGTGAGGTLSPFSWGDGAWDQLMSCVRERYGRFDIEVTDVEPAGSNYIEVPVGGWAAELGSPEEYDGQAPMDCVPYSTAIAFAYAENHDPADLEDLCWTVLQESAHALALDHETLCSDPMTYDRSCGSRKAFQDNAASCGEYGPRTCSCGAATQNSVELLLAAAGPSNDHAPPQLTITAPVEGAVVAPGFGVTADAQDDIAVVKVELLIDGVLNATDTTAPWSFSTSTEMADGDHGLEVRAYDASGNMVPAQVNVTVDPMGGDGTEAPGGPGSGPGGGGVIGGCTLASTPANTSAPLASLALLLCLLLLKRR